MIAAMASMIPRKNSTLFTTAARMLSKGISVGMTTLTAPAKSPVSHPSFA